MYSFLPCGGLVISIGRGLLMSMNDNSVPVRFNILFFNLSNTLNKAVLGNSSTRTTKFPCGSRSCTHCCGFIGCGITITAFTKKRSVGDCCPPKPFGIIPSPAHSVIFCSNNDPGFGAASNTKLEPNCLPLLVIVFKYTVRIGTKKLPVKAASGRI